MTVCTYDRFGQTYLDLHKWSIFPDRNTCHPTSKRKISTTARTRPFEVHFRPNYDIWCNKTTW